MKQVQSVVFIVTLLFFVSLVLFFCASARAADVTLTWDDPGHPEWGTRILIGTASGTYTNSHDAGVGVAETVVENLVPGVTYYFVAVNYFMGEESGTSNEVSYTPPTNYTELPELPELPGVSELQQYEPSISRVEI